MTMLDVKYGTVFDGICSHRLGIVSAVTNIFWRDEHGAKHDDAALLLMRRSFGRGQTNITLLRQNAYQATEPELLHQMAQNAADQLLSGSANVSDVVAIANLINDQMDALISHPPESEADMRKRQQKQVADDGLLLKVNGKTLVDAR